jgi:uncharacterized protein (TIGR02145 family)
MFMFKFACFFSFICIYLFLVACGDGGTSEPILYPVGKFESSSSSFEKVSSGETMSRENQSSSAESDTSSEEFCVENECFVTDKRDGNVYRIIEIGEQLWMAQDLMYEIVNQQCFDESVNDCAKYDGLYSWSAAMDSAGNFSLNGLGCGDGLVCVPASPVRGICPAGWHLPNNNEIKNMIYAMMHNSDLDLFGRSTFWLSTEENDQNAFYMGLNMTEEHKSMMASPKSDLKKTLLNVRCLKGKSSDGAAVVSSSSSVSVNSSSSEIKSSSSCDVHVSYGEMTDERDAHVYRTMTIDGCTTKKNESGEYRVKVPRQTWMAENLNYAYLQPTSTLDSSSWCYNNEPDSCVKYGRLYLWSAAMDSAALFSEDAKGCGFYRNAESWQKCHVTGMGRGVCPEGWHLPTRQEYDGLQSTTPLVCKMKNDAQVTNGFLLQFGGLYYAEPDCCTVYNYTNGEHFFEWGEDASFFWFASEGTIGSDAYRVMVEEVSCVPSTVSTYKFFAFSVRCVKDVPDVE